MIPASGFFAAKDFSGADAVLIGRSDDWISVQTNSRTLHLKIDKERPFPSIDLQIPTQGSAATTLVLAEDDVDLLTAAHLYPGVARRRRCRQSQQPDHTHQFPRTPPKNSEGD